MILIGKILGKKIYLWLIYSINIFVIRNDYILRKDDLIKFWILV